MKKHIIKSETVYIICPVCRSLTNIIVFGFERDEERIRKDCSYCGASFWYSPKTHRLIKPWGGT